MTTIGACWPYSPIWTRAAEDPEKIYEEISERQSLN